MENYNFTQKKKKLYIYIYIYTVNTFLGNRIKLNHKVNSQKIKKNKKKKVKQRQKFIDQEKFNYLKSKISFSFLKDDIDVFGLDLLLPVGLR